MPSVEELVAIKERVEQRFLDQPGVTGIDVGYKVVGGERTGEIAVRVYVARKTDDVPLDQRVPPDIDGVVTDVLERTYELHVAARPLGVSLQSDTTHYTTLQGGVSMGPSRAVGGFVYAGTLGAVVIDNTTQAHVALTNFHVAAVDSTWQTGDRMVQPSRIDTGVVPTDEFGAILRATLSDAVDGAVISIDPGRATSCQIVDIGDVRGTKTAALGTAVRKRGRTTGLTYGTVDGISASVRLDYGDGLGVHVLTNQVSIAADTPRNAVFSDHGDSGSVIVDDGGFVIALLFGGSGSNTVGNPIAAVESELDISLCVGRKSIVKDLKDGQKDFTKDKELHKDLSKDKELHKDLVKEKELQKELIKEKEVLEHKQLKDVIDVHKPPELPPGLPGGPPPVGAPSAFEQRLSAIEAQLARLSTFIEPGQRPDLRGAAFSNEPQAPDPGTEELRAALEKQAADAAAAKAAFDTPQM
ncbi:hypothetical protein [Kitasatospora sp. NPDC057015]|uniref:hypothetical protein n=1 Tax=Kitasatospora sp. NPDC057015 TaxID=3346001 RepID=UPI003636122D